MLLNRGGTKSFDWEQIRMDGKNHGKKYFISDTHIGERKENDDFKYKEENLIFLLNEIIKQNPDPAEPGELILLGDFFDFLEVKIDVRDEDREKEIGEIINEIKREYPELFSSIKNFIGSGHKIFYVCGNHDYEMRFPRISQLVAGLMLPDGMSLSQGSRFFQISDYYVSAKFKIYAEHGHRFDPENWHYQGMPECFGSILVKNFLTTWESDYRNLDNLRPRGNIYYHIRQKCEKKANEETLILLNDLYKVHKEYLWLCRVYNFNHCKVNLRSLKIKILLALADKSDRWDSWNNFIFKKTEKLIVEALNEDCTTYRERAIKLMNLCDKEYIANQKDLNFQPDHFIFGHTHFFDHYKLEGGKNYFNTASWLDTTFYDKQRNLISTDKVIAGAPVLVFSEPDKYPVLYDVSVKPNRMVEKSFEEVKDIYKTHGIKI